MARSRGVRLGGTGHLTVVTAIDRQRGSITLDRDMTRCQYLRPDGVMLRRTPAGVRRVLCGEPVTWLYVGLPFCTRHAKAWARMYGNLAWFRRIKS